MVEIRLFGRVRVQHGLEAKETILSGVLADLLTYLVLHRHRLVERDTLVDVFWREEDPKHAHRCLSTALWRLRQVLEPSPVLRGKYLICPSPCEVGIDVDSDYHLDTLEFEARSRLSLAKPPCDLQPDDVQALGEAISVYEADLAESCQYPWVLGERERLRNLFLSCQEHLMRYYASHDLHERSVEFGQQVLENDPLREEVHQQVIRSYLGIGQRSLAVRQYFRCQQALALFLNCEPMEETKALLRKVVDPVEGPEGRPEQVSGEHDAAIEFELMTVYEQLASVVHTLREVELQLEVVARRLDVCMQDRSKCQSRPVVGGDSVVTLS